MPVEPAADGLKDFYCFISVVSHSCFSSNLLTLSFPLPVTSGLQTDEGLHLMEILARMAKIQMTDFTELWFVIQLFLPHLSFSI